MRWHIVEAPLDSCQDVDEWRRSLESILTEISRENADGLSMIRVRISRGPVHRQLEGGYVLDER